MATALGQRYLDRYAAGTATLEQLNACLTRGWISQDEYDAATAPEPVPEPDAETPES